VADPFTAPEHALNYIHDLLEDKAGELGLGFVAYGDEKMLPTYPAVRCVAGPMTKDLHATSQWMNILTVELWIYHANLTQSHAARSKKDLELATAIRELLHSRRTCEGGVIFGYITVEQPALLTRAKGASVVGTRLTWTGNQVQLFS
jgi:hypothetical protein